MRRRPPFEALTATFFPLWSHHKGDFVDALKRLKSCDGGSEIRCCADGVHYIDTGVAVRQAVVVVRGDVQLVGMPHINEFGFCMVLKIDDNVALNHQIIGHFIQFTTSFQISKRNGGVPHESTSVFVPSSLHQPRQISGEIVVNAQGNDFAHAPSPSSPFIIIHYGLFISFDYILMVERKPMTTQWQRALIASLLLILSSLAGCLGGDEEPESATVIASTYHVAQLAEAVGGGLVDVEMMSTSNVPVHDYEPSATDIIRLNSADVFLYHGLGLEPWVDGALADLAADGPAVYSTHAMPSGEDTLDFQTILINKLCTSMTGPATTDVHTLAHHPHEAEELHGDDGGHNFAFPDHGEEHDHDEEEHDHDEDEHDHGDHDALSPEMTFDNPEGCDAGTSINVFHMEAGEYMLEFESESEDPFRMAVAGMGGAHDHGHDHGDHGHHDHDGHDHHDHGTEGHGDH